MSRCFPFPPPGYARHSDALIDSIKIQSVSKKAKKDRKKDKESKEKRREKKDKRKEKKGKEVIPSNHDAIVGKEFKLIEQTTVYCVQQKGAYHENEQLLERSDITEEHDQPVACCSDSIQSSSKRKRSTSPSPSTTTHSHGTVKRIRFLLRKRTEPEQSKLEDQLVLASKSVGPADSSSRISFDGNHLLPGDTNAERDQFIHSEELQFPRANGAASNIRQKDGAALNTNLIEDEGIQFPGANGAASSICQKDGGTSNTNLIEDEEMRMVSVYDSLFQNWVPPSLSACDGFDLEEDDWLFRSEPQEERPISKTATHATGALRCSGTSLWPRAQYLPEVETYALPYVVPF